MKTPKPLIPTALGWNPTGDLGPYTIYTAKDGRPVLFPKAPPKTPPTWKQQLSQLKFSNALQAWRRLPSETRQRWQLAATRAHLRVTGLNLWIFYQLKKDDAAIRTIERQSRVPLLPT